MLRAYGRFVVGSALLAADCAIGPGVASLVVSRERLRYDTRFLPTSAPVLRNGLVLYALLEGSVHWRDGNCFEAPVALALPSDEFEDATHAANHYRVIGESVRMLEFWLDGHEAVRRPPTTLKGPLLDAAEALYSVCSPGSASPEAVEQARRDF
ncbi:MAG: hypothetical protein ACXVEF_41260, partial [Polyangiales bacterium]